MKKRSRFIASTLALMVMAGSSVASSFAAGSATVKISGSKGTAAPGADYTIEISLADIPTTGANACEFAVKYNSSLVTVTSVKAGGLTETGAASADSTATTVPLFDYYINTSKSTVNAVWSTGAENSNVWLKGSGVFFTISGKVAAGAANGSVADFEIVPIARETYPGSGVINNKIVIGSYNGTTKTAYSYTVSNGSLTIGSGASGVLYGDANCSGDVTIDDVVAVRLYCMKPAVYPLTDKGVANAKVVSGQSTVQGNCAVAIQDFVVEKIKSLPIA